MSPSQNNTMKFLVLMLSMAAAAVLAVPTPAAATANTEVVRAEKAPKFELPREVLRDVKSSDSTDGEMSTVCISPVNYSQSIISSILFCHFKSVGGTAANADYQEGNWSPIKPSPSD